MEEHSPEYLMHCQLLAENGDHSEEYLMHYGILGMHWGVRRYQNPDGTLTSAGRRHYSAGKMSDEELASATKRLKAEQEYKDAKKKLHPDGFIKTTAKKVRDKVTDQLIDKAVNKMFKKEPETVSELLDRGWENLTVEEAKSLAAALLAKKNLETKPAKPPANRPPSSDDIDSGRRAIERLTEEIERLRRNQQLGGRDTTRNEAEERGMTEEELQEYRRRMEDEEAWQSDHSSEYLMHYGIKGQKWGVRRYQNEDGTLTDEGKKHYGVMTTPIAVAESLAVAKKNPAAMTPQERLDLVDSVNKKVLVANTATILATPLLPVSGVCSVVNTVEYAHAKKVADKYEKLRENTPVDQETGLHLKEEELTDAEDAKRVNPGFSTLSVGTTQNCMCCTAAVELRKRGYEVCAQEDALGYTSDIYEKWFPGSKVDYIAKDALSKYTSDNLSEIESINDLKDSRSVGIMNGFNFSYNKEFKKATIDGLRSQGDGSRGNLMIQFFDGFSGHSVHYEVKGGSVVITDGQSGKIYTEKEFEKLLGNCWNAEAIRLDNLDFDVTEIKQAVK